LKPPTLSIKTPPTPSKVLEKNKPPGGLNRGFTVSKKNTNFITEKLRQPPKQNS